MCGHVILECGPLLYLSNSSLSFQFVGVHMGSRSGLHLAAHMAHVDVLEHLIKMCPNMVNGEDPSGTTPLIRVSVLVLCCSHA